MSRRETCDYTTRRRSRVEKRGSEMQLLLEGRGEEKKDTV